VLSLKLVLLGREFKSVHKRKPTRMIGLGRGKCLDFEIDYLVRKPIKSNPQNRHISLFRLVCGALRRSQPIRSWKNPRKVDFPYFDHILRFPSQMLDVLSRAMSQKLENCLLYKASNVHRMSIHLVLYWRTENSY
jgi:hypothetical protein